MTPDHEREFSTFRPSMPGLRKLLGDLEADIMETMWAAEPDAKLTVRDVHNQLQSKRKTAYTTMMTVMGILTKKGLLEVEKAGMAHHYRASLSRDAFTVEAVGRVLDGLLSDFPEPALAHFTRTLREKDPARLDRLKDLLARHTTQEP